VDTNHYMKSQYDVPLVGSVIVQIRGRDLPILRDDYILGIVVRGHHHLPPHYPAFDKGPWPGIRRRHLQALRQCSETCAFVRW